MSTQLRCDPFEDNFDVSLYDALNNLRARERSATVFLNGVKWTAYAKGADGDKPGRVYYIGVPVANRHEEGSIR